VSGPGLVAIYQYLRDGGRAPEDPELANRLERTDPGDAISRAAAAGDPLGSAASSSTAPPTTSRSLSPTFRRLIRGQAEGDRRALEQRQRRVLAVDLGDGAAAAVDRLAEAVAAGAPAAV
jgi:hypothetical protein